MNASSWIMAVWGFFTFKGWRDRRKAIKRRERYNEIRALVVEQHYNGKGGMILPAKYDNTDLFAFKPPLYQWARTTKNEPVLTWRREFMSAEIGDKPAEPTDESN